MKKIKYINLILFQGIFWLSLCNAVFATENPIQSDIHWRIESPSSFAKGVNILKSDSQNPPTKITLPNLMNGKNYSVPIVWDESWLDGDSFSYNHGLARVLCALSLAAYTNVADSGAYNCLQELYKVLGFSENEIEYHYGVDFSDAELGKDQVAYSFAIQKLADGTELVAVAVRGTAVSQEWASNLNVADSIFSDAQDGKLDAPPYHEGFWVCTKQVLLDLKDFLLRKATNPATVKFLICGHSRGGAVANLLSAQLLENGFSAKNIYAYTVACPNVSRTLDVWDSKYGFIWNIVNQEDLVTSMPTVDGGWGFRKYGNEMALISSYTCPDFDSFSTEFIPAMNRYFFAATGHNYHPFDTGNLWTYVLSKLLRDFNSDVNSFYTGKMPLHNAFSKLLQTSFWADTGDENQKPSLIQSYVESLYPGLLDSLMASLVDMHCGETYLSWLLALPPEKLYTITNNYVLEINGKASVVVRDSLENEIVRIINGSPEKIYSSRGHYAVKFLDGKTVISIPGNRNTSVSISSTSIFDTPVVCTVKSYLSGNNLKDEYYFENLSVNIGKSYLFKFTGGNPSFFYANKNSGASALLVSAHNEKNELQFSPKVFIQNGWNFGAGCQIGNPYVHLTGEVSTGILGGFKSISISAGFGTRTILVGSWSLGLDLSCAAFMSSLGSEDFAVCAIPEALLSVLYQPAKKLNLQFSVGAELCVENWNQKAFSSVARTKNLLAFPLGSSGASIYPVFRFSVLF